MFKRKIESELYKYYEAKDNPKILIVYGARQIGKSYIIRETAKVSFKHYAEIDLIDDSNSVFELADIDSNIKVHKTFLSSRLNHISLSFRIICYWNVKALFNLFAIKRKAVCLSMESDSRVSYFS